MGLKGLKAEKPKKYVWFFAVDEDDFKSYFGDSFVLVAGPEKGRRAYIDEKKDVIITWILATNDACIVGRRNIEVRYSDKFRDTSKFKDVRREVDICNFISNKHVDFDILPKSVKELMKE